MQTEDLETCVEEEMSLKNLLAMAQLVTQIHACIRFRF